VSPVEKNFYQFTLLRHGESIGNAQSRWQGQSDYPLTERGRAQAHALAERWVSEVVKFDLIIASPLVRAKETAQIIATVLQANLEIDPIWMERNVGEMSGMTVEEVRKLPAPPFFTPYQSIGGQGEGDWELYLRAGSGLHKLLRRPAGCYLIVSHGGLLNQLMHAIVGIAHHADPGGIRFRFENCSFSQVTYYPHQNRWSIETVNDRTHLKSPKSWDYD
jgi:broad specificity phosphatase PhoE